MSIIHYPLTMGECQSSSSNDKRVSTIIILQGDNRVMRLACLFPLPCRENIGICHLSTLGECSELIVFALARPLLALSLQRLRRSCCCLESSMTTGQRPSPDHKSASTLSSWPVESQAAVRGGAPFRLGPSAKRVASKRVGLAVPVQWFYVSWLPLIDLLSCTRVESSPVIIYVLRCLLWLHPSDNFIFFDEIP